MARSVATIKAEILAEKANHSELDGLNSPSQTAIYNLWAHIIAVIINIHEQLWDVFRAEVNEYVARSIPGTVRWYHEQTLAFQYGDALQYINGVFQYDPVDETKRIIKRVAVTEIGGQVRIKVSKLDQNGNPCKLDALELAAFVTYINQIKFAGTNIAVINYDPDLVQITMDVYYDPLVMRPDGSLISDNSMFPVNDAIDDYLAGIIYGGHFNNIRMIDAVQAASGVIDPVLSLVEAKADNASTWTTVVYDYEAVAGYLIIDQLTVNYIPNV